MPNPMIPGSKLPQPKIVFQLSLSEYYTETIKMKWNFAVYQKITGGGNDALQ